MRSTASWNTERGAGGYGSGPLCIQKSHRKCEPPTRVDASGVHLDLVRSDLPG
jgi:hypothetical protein